MDVVKLKDFVNNYNKNCVSHQCFSLCAIFTNNRELADDYIKTKRRVDYTRKTRNDTEWYLENGEHWRCFDLNNEMPRGLKFHKVVVDPNIPEKFFVEKVLPYCIYCNSMEILE